MGRAVAESSNARLGSQVSRAASDYSGRALGGHRELCGHHGGWPFAHTGFLVVDGWDLAIAGLRSGRGALSRENTAIIFRPDSRRFVAVGVHVFRAVKPRPPRVAGARAGSIARHRRYATLLRGVYYICVFIALVLLMRSRVDRLPLTLGLDGVAVGLGAATMAALWAPVLGGGFAQIGDHAYPPDGGSAAAYPRLGCDVVVPMAPPPSLWLLAGSLLVFGSADCIYAIAGGAGLL